MKFEKGRSQKQTHKPSAKSMKLMHYPQVSTINSGEDVRKVDLAREGPTYNEKGLTRQHFSDR